MDSFFNDFESSPDSHLESMPDNMNIFDFEFPTSSLSDLFGNRDSLKLITNSLKEILEIFTKIIPILSIKITL